MAIGDKMKTFIKVVNPNDANRLVSLGFSYITEQINKDTVYVFELTSELHNAIMLNFSQLNFFQDDKLRF